MKSYSWASLVTSLFILGSYFYETIVENQCLSLSHSWTHTPLPSSQIGHALLYALLFSYQPINHRLYYEWTPGCIIPHLRPHMISIALRWDVRFLSLGHQNPLRLSHPSRTGSTLIHSLLRLPWMLQLPYCVSLRSPIMPASSPSEETVHVFLLSEFKCGFCCLSGFTLSSPLPLCELRKISVTCKLEGNLGFASSDTRSHFQLQRSVGANLRTSNTLQQDSRHMSIC